MMSIDQTTILANHIQKHASDYYRGFVSEQTRVQLVDKQERRTALLYRFKVISNTQIRSVFVKVPYHSSSNNQMKGSVYEKPLLYPKADPQDMHRLHYSALRAIDEYFTRLNKKNLGAIRVLDYLPEYHAIFTEESNDSTLRQRFLRKNRFSSPFLDTELSPVFQNVGTWLSVYHKMPKEQDVSIRDAYRQDYIDAIGKLTDFLVKILGDESFFKNTASILIKGAQKVLPETLPLGLGHGDFALRNILIGPNCRVTVLDTFAKWRTPVYEDIGYFLNDLKLSYPQVVSHGLAFSSNQLSMYERAFLQGYFGTESIPHRAIRLYEALALLDKWSSAIARSYQRPKSIKIVDRLNLKLMSRYFKTKLKRLLTQLSEN